MTKGTTWFEGWLDMYVGVLSDEVAEGFGFEATPKGFAFKVSEGVVRMKTPTGAEVALTTDEEHEIAKQALKDSLKMKMTASERRLDTTMNSALHAVGYAVGLGLSGLAMALVIGALSGKKKKRVAINLPFAAK